MVVIHLLQITMHGLLNHLSVTCVTGFRMASNQLFYVGHGYSVYTQHSICIVVFLKISRYILTFITVKQI